MRYSNTAARAALCAALALSCAGGASAQKRQPSKGKPAETKPAAAAAARPQVKALDEAGLKALLDENRRAGRRLLINFWATWCTPCREEFPDLVRVEEEFGPRSDFEFVTVSLDDPSEIDKAVPAFLAETGASSIPAYLMNADDQEAVITLVDQDWQGNLPATFLFGPDGALLFRHTGRVKPDELRKAINGPTPTPASAQK